MGRRRYSGGTLSLRTLLRCQHLGEEATDRTVPVDPAEKVGQAVTDRGKPDGQPKRAVHNYDTHIGGGPADHG
jgi:hypothetical protein